MAQASEVVKTDAVVSPKADGVERKTDQLIADLDTPTLDKLVKLVNYKHKDRIALFGVTSVQKEMRHLCTEFIREMIAQRHKQLTDQIKNRSDKDISEYFRFLVAKGTPTGQAYKMAYGVEPPEAKVETKAS